MTRSATADVLFGQEAGLKQQVLERVEEFAIEMRYIVKEVKNQVSETFPGNNILLSTSMAITTDDRGATIQAVFLLAFGGVAHCKFLLKINSPFEVKKRTSIKLNNIECGREISECPSFHY